MHQTAVRDRQLLGLLGRRKPLDFFERFENSRARRLLT
jgi:hypothetical protein